MSLQSGGFRYGIFTPSVIILCSCSFPFVFCPPPSTMSPSYPSFLSPYSPPVLSYSVPSCPVLSSPLFPLPSLCFWDRAPRNSGWPQTHCIVELGLELLIFVSLPLKCWDYKCMCPCAQPSLYCQATPCILVFLLPALLKRSFPPWYVSFLLLFSSFKICPFLSGTIKTFYYFLLINKSVYCTIKVQEGERRPWGLFLIS